MASIAVGPWTSAMDETKEIEFVVHSKGDRKCIDLSFKSITDDRCEKLAGSLALRWSELSPTALSFSCNSISAMGACILSDILSSEECRNPVSLTHIDFSANSVGDEGVLGLLKVLETQPKLTHLNLRANQITDKGAIHLAEFLAQNDSLHHLDLSANYIEDAGAEELARAIRTNQGLRSINLLTNSIEKSGNDALKASLQSNPRITDVNKSTRSDILNDVCTIS